MDGNLGGHYLGYITLVGSDFMKPSEFKSGTIVYTKLTSTSCIYGILLKHLTFYKYINMYGETKYRIYCWIKSTKGRNEVISLRTLDRFYNKK